MIFAGEEVPEDMTTPSGEAQGTSGSQGGTTNPPTGGEEGGTTPPPAGGEEGGTTTPPADEEEGGTTPPESDEQDGTTAPAPGTTAPTPDTDAPEDEECVHAFDAWVDLDDGVRVRTCMLCDATETSEKKDEALSENGCNAVLGGASVFMIPVALLGFALVARKKEREI